MSTSRKNAKSALQNTQIQTRRGDGWLFKFGVARRSTRMLQPSTVCPACDEPCAPGRHLWTHLQKSPECRLAICGPADDEETDAEEESKDDVVAAAAEAAGQGGAAAGIRSRVAWDLMTLKLKHGHSKASLDFLKTCVTAWLEEIRGEQYQRLKHLLGGGVGERQAMAALEVSAFDGIETDYKLQRYTQREYPSLPARVVTLEHEGINETVVSFGMADLLERKLQADGPFRRQVVEASNRWKVGDLYQKAPSSLTGFESGSSARWHPHMLRPATEDEECDLRAAIDFQADEALSPR